LQVHADLAVRAPETLDSATLFKIGTEIGQLSDVISSEYLK